MAKEFHCSTCSGSFTMQGDLNLHRKQSSTCGIVGLGAHGCTGCGATFQYSKSLTEHGRFCGGHKCMTCDNDVYSITSWTRHCDGNDKLDECCALPEQMLCPHGCGMMIDADTHNGKAHCFSCAKNPHVLKMQREMQMLPENKYLRPIVLHRRLAEDREYDHYNSTKPRRVVLLRKAGPARVDLAHVKYNNGACELVTSTCGFGGYIIPDQTQQSVADQALLKDVAALLQQKEWEDAGYHVCQRCKEYHDEEKDWIACSGAECPHGGWVCRKTSKLGDAAFNAECARDDDIEWCCPACDVQEGGGASSSTQMLAVCHVCEEQSYGTLACSADNCPAAGATCKCCAEKQGLPAGDRNTFLCCHCEPACVSRVDAAYAFGLSRLKARRAAERERDAEEWNRGAPEREQRAVAKRERDAEEDRALWQAMREREALAEANLPLIERLSRKVNRTGQRAVYSAKRKLHDMLAAAWVFD